MKINTHLDFQGNEIKLAAPEKVTTLPDSNLFIGRTCVLISEKEVDDTTISVGSIYYYNGEQWCHIEVESLKIDETKINVIDDEITLHTFDTLADVKTYINSNKKPKSVVIGSDAGITSIGDGAFSGCTSLTSITIPDSVTSIGNNAFSGCTSLTSIIIPSGVTSIGNYAFAGTSLKSIIILSGVTSIGDGAFSGCTSLTSITIPDSVTSIGNNAFKYCDILLLDDYKSRTGYPWGATNILIHNEDVTTTIDSNSTDRQVPTANSVYDFIAENIFSIKFDMDYLKEYIERTITSITIPNSVTSIGRDAFKSCTDLTSVTIPDTVTSIGVNAFLGSSLTSITIPSSVTSIGVNAFYNCISLTSITINKPEGSITGAPWGATNATVQWTG